MFVENLVEINGLVFYLNLHTDTDKYFVKSNFMNPQTNISTLISNSIFFTNHYTFSMWESKRHRPLTALCEVVADVVPRGLALSGGPGGRGLDQFHHAEPVSESLSEGDSKVPSVRLQVQSLGLVKLVEISSNLLVANISFHCFTDFGLHKRVPCL